MDRYPERKIGLKLLRFLPVFCLAAAIASPAQTLTTLVSFDGTDGSAPSASLIQASDGNLYGTTVMGGASSGGTIFKMTPAGAITTLHSFAGPEGYHPYAPLVQGHDGNFYGTANSGGAHDIGSVFKITPSGTFTVLHFFNYTYGEGGYPGPLVAGSDGYFYGVTSNGGDDNLGTVFQVSADGSTFSTLYYFASSVGKHPNGALLQGRDGNFYGVSPLGGSNGYGTVFRITPSGAASVIYTFCPQGDCTAGGSPNGALLQTSDGNFYGGAGGGTYDGGVIFKVTPGGALTTLHSFNRTDGLNPNGTLVQGSDGNFYGTTVQGGAHGDGTVFQITPSGSLTTLYSFCSQSGCADGATPLAGVIQASDGKFYGTTNAGGADGLGTVFKLTPLVPTTTVLVTAPNPSNLGQTVTMTATVTAQNGATPTGTVVFNSNGSQIGSASLNNSGVAVLVYSSLPLGIDSLQALYQGSGNFASSTSNTVLQAVGITTTSVTSTPNPSTVGQMVTITATVSPGAPGGALPTGTVSFTSNSTAISGCTGVSLSQSLTAVCPTSTLPVGTDAIVATYSGDSNYVGSSGMVIADCQSRAHRRCNSCRCHRAASWIRASQRAVRRAADRRPFLARLSARAEWQPVQHSRHGRGVFAQRHGGAATHPGIPDHLADRRRAAGGLHAEFAGWARQSQCRHRSRRERPLARSACM